MFSCSFGQAVTYGCDDYDVCAPWSARPYLWTYPPSYVRSDDVCAPSPFVIFDLLFKPTGNDH